MKKINELEDKISTISKELIDEIKQVTLKALKHLKKINEGIINIKTLIQIKVDENELDQIRDSLKHLFFMDNSLPDRFKTRINHQSTGISLDLIEDYLTEESLKRRSEMLPYAFPSDILKRFTIHNRNQSNQNQFYIGTIDENDSKNGYGLQIFEDGSIFEGSISGGLAEGYGRKILKNGDFYSGEFSKGLRQGNGNFFPMDKKDPSYHGQWYQDKKHGVGNESLNNKNLGNYFYKMDIKIDLTNKPKNNSEKSDKSACYGNGERLILEKIEIEKRPNSVKSDVQNNKINKLNLNDKEEMHKFDSKNSLNSTNSKRAVKDMFYFPDGSKYQGEWLDDQIDGEGCYFKKEINSFITYKGSWTKNQLKKGEINWPNQDTYKGDIEDFKMHGKGTFQDNNGNQYKGIFENHQIKKGTLIMQNGDSYIGSFLNWKYNGKGKFTKNNGEIYKGNWTSGKKHGDFEVKQLDGKIAQIYYSYDQCAEN